MLNPIKEIAKWQIQAGNASRPYDDFLESSFQIEEALEPCDPVYLENINNALWPAMSAGDLDSFYENTPKDVSRNIAALAGLPFISAQKGITDVQRLDKACDAIVYAIGSMQKLGLDHHGITKALNIVNKANMQKLNCPRDEAGKLLKPDDFVGPEPELQALLDSYK